MLRQRLTFAEAIERFDLMPRTRIKRIRDELWAQLDALPLDGAEGEIQASAVGVSEQDDLIGDMIAEVARSHGVAISRDDPVVAVVLLNQIVLRRYLEETVAPAADAIRDATNEAVRQIEQFAEAQATWLEQVSLKDRASFLEEQKALHDAWKADMETLIEGQNTGASAGGDADGGFAADSDTGRGVQIDDDRLATSSRGTKNAWAVYSLGLDISGDSAGYRSNGGADGNRLVSACGTVGTGTGGAVGRRGRHSFSATLAGIPCEPERIVVCPRYPPDIPRKDDHLPQRPCKWAPGDFVADVVNVDRDRDHSRVGSLRPRMRKHRNLFNSGADDGNDHLRARSLCVQRTALGAR